MKQQWQFVGRNTDTETGIEYYLWHTYMWPITFPEILGGGTQYVPHLHAIPVATFWPKPPGPPHPVPRADRQGTICEDYELYGCAVNTCPAGCYLAPADQ